MTKPLRFDDEAVEELEAAAGWYEAEIRIVAIARTSREQGSGAADCEGRFAA
jgi:hypothetical protein